MRYFLFIISILLFSPSITEASGIFPSNYSREFQNESVVTGQGQKVKKQKKKRRSPKADKGKGNDNAFGAFMFWWVLVPLTIIASLTLGLIFLGPFWYVGLGLFAIWAGISGIVFFPIQYIGLPLGMALIVYGLIVGFPLIWTAGIALVFAAIFALAYMVLMFMIGTRKNQPE
jgi:hypothetical protein